MIACLLNLRAPSVWLPFMSVKELPFDQEELLSQDGREEKAYAYFLYRNVRNQVIPLLEKLVGGATFSKNGCSPINNKARKFTTT
jgi:hypothetical protein